MSAFSTSEGPMRRLLSLALILALAAGALAASPAHADDPTPIVSWPEITQFNPELVDYEIELADAGGAGELVAWWGYDFRRSTVLPHTGAAALEFGHEGIIDVVVARCEAGYQRLTDCAEVARSPRLTVLTRLDPLFINVRSVVGLGATEVQIRNFTPVSVDRYDWEISGEGQSEVLAGGTANAPFREGRNGAEAIDVQVPPTLVSGRYELRVTGTASTAAYGVLTGVVASSFRYNGALPVLKVRPSRTTFHPYPDGYQDDVTLDVVVDQDVNLELEVTDATDAGVYRSGQFVPADSSAQIVWGGSNSAGNRVAPGAYDLTLRGMGDGGNQTEWHGKVVVSGKRLVTVTKSFKVGAAASRGGKPYVGKCSNLARKAKGGLGFYSQTKCRGNQRRSTVGAYFGAYLPRAIEGRYRSVQVTLNGGPATRSRTNYINLGYAAPKRQRVVKVKTLRGKGALRGKVASPGQIFERTKQRPFLIWWVGLSEGSRFDVASFRVTTTYQVLR